MKLVAHLVMAVASVSLSTAAVAADTKPAAQAAKAAKPAKPAAAERAPQETGRNWTAIDTNKDGLISPEEMEAFLQANPGPLKGK